MAEDINIDLNVDTVGPRDSRREVTRLTLVYACSYTKDGGAPTLTADCTSVGELESEAKRLTQEIADAVDRARVHYGEADATKSKRPQAAEPARGPRPPRPRVDTDLAVGDVMTRDVRTVSQNDQLSVADELMKVGHFRHLVVVDDGGVSGVISRRDIFHGALAWSLGQGAAAHQKMLETYPVKQVMETAVVTVRPDTSLVDAATLMIEKKIGCLPVLDGSDLVGILTEGDFLALLTGQ